MKASRIAVLAVGLGILGVGGFQLTRALHTPAQWIDLGCWLLAAVVLHDAVLAPALHVGGTLLQRVLRGVPAAGRTLVRTVLLTAALLSAVGLAETRARADGPRNPTVLPLDYPVTVLVVWVVAFVVCAVTIVTGRRRRT